MQPDPGQPISVAALLSGAAARLPGDEARSEAGQLLAEVLGVNRSWLFAHADALVAPAVATRFEALLQRRLEGEPVAYLLGRRGFWRFDLQVTPDTLIPRPETEVLVELALARLPQQRALRAADLGTGTGAIALALASERAQLRVVATDASAATLAVAHRNAVSLRLLDRIEFRHGDWCAPLAGDAFDLIASNPPYIEAGDPHLLQGDLRFEPASALASGVDGLDAIRTLTRDAPTHLVPGGWLLLEHGWTQGAAVRALLRAAGLVEVVTEHDLEGRDRVTLGRRSG